MKFNITIMIPNEGLLKMSEEDDSRTSILLPSQENFLESLQYTDELNICIQNSDYPDYAFMIFGIGALQRKDNTNQFTNGINLYIHKEQLQEMKNAIDAALLCL